MKSIKKVKIAFVHDDFIQHGGAEKLFLEIIKEFSYDERFDVKVFSSLISQDWKGILAKNKITIQESFLAKIPFCYRLHKLFFIFDLFYLAFSDFDFSDFDIVISSSTRFGHFLITKPSVFHISYINSPARALWDEKKYFFQKNFLYKLVNRTLPNKRVYDYYSQNYSDLIISNSKNIKKKVQKIYNRNSLVLYPFHTLSNLSNSLYQKEHFLIISRLVSWKRLDYVINVFNSLNEELIVLGTGPELNYYQKISNKNIKFYGYVSEEEKISLLLKAKALIFPQIEDFGITILESLALNCPIIYLDKGGAKEILNNNVGIPFDYQNEKNLNEAISKLDDFVFLEESKLKILKNYSKTYSVDFLKRLVLKSINKGFNLV